MKLRLTRLQQQQQLIQNKPHIIITDPHVIVGGAVSRAAAIALKTPSPLTPISLTENSLDELLPCVIETAEVCNHYLIWFIFFFLLNIDECKMKNCRFFFIFELQPPTPVKLHRSEAYTGLCKSTLSDELFN